MVFNQLIQENDNIAQRCRNLIKGTAVENFFTVINGQGLVKKGGKKLTHPERVADGLKKNSEKLVQSKYEDES